MTDEVLIKKISEGDSQAFESLFQKHKRAVYGLSLRLLGSQMLAEENSQEVWIRVVEHACRFEPTGTVISWILKITKNLALNTIEKRGWEEPLPLESEEKLQAENAEITELLGNTEDIKKLQKAIEELPDRQRIAILLWMNEEKSYSELAIELKINVNAVKVLLFRAKENIARSIKEGT